MITTELRQARKNSNGKTRTCRHCHRPVTAGQYYLDGAQHGKGRVVHASCAERMIWRTRR